MIGLHLFHLDQIEAVRLGEAREGFGEGTVAREGRCGRAVAHGRVGVGDADGERDLRREAEIVEVVTARQHDDIGLQRSDAGADLHHAGDDTLGLLLHAGRREQNMRHGEAANDPAHQRSSKRSR